MSAVRKAKRAYREFHGRWPDKVITVEVPDPPEHGWLLGELVEIVYKPRSPTTRKGEYAHLFGDYGDQKGGERPLLVIDPEGQNIFIAKEGSRFTVGPRGIVG